MAQIKLFKSNVLVQILFASVLLFSPSLWSAVTVGEKLPALEIQKRGELILDEKDNVKYQPWSTEKLAGKVQVLQYMAGRMSARDLNKPFTDALEKRAYSLDYHNATTIINLDDTLFGTAGIVNGQLKSNKKRYWFSSIVADKSGKGAELWGLKPKSSAIMILSPTQEVLFFKDGSLTDEEIESNLDLIGAQIEQLNSAAATAATEPNSKQPAAAMQ